MVGPGGVQLPKHSGCLINKLGWLKPGSNFGQGQTVSFKYVEEDKVPNTVLLVVDTLM